MKMQLGVYVEVEVDGNRYKAEKDNNREEDVVRRASRDRIGRKQTHCQGRLILNASIFETLSSKFITFLVTDNFLHPFRCSIHKSWSTPLLHC